MIHTTLGNCRFRLWRRPSDVLLGHLSMRGGGVHSARVGVFVQPVAGSRTAGLEWLDSSSAWRPSGYSPGPGPQASANCSYGRGQGCYPGHRRVWPHAQGPRLEARPAEGARGRPCQPQPQAGGGFGPRPTGCGPPGAGTHLSGNEGRRSRTLIPLERELSRPRQLSRLCGRATSAWQSHPPPLAWRGASLSLRGSPPPRQMAVGRKLDTLLGSRARRRSREGAPSWAGCWGDVLTSCQRKELDASKVLFTAGLCLLQS